MMSLGLLGSDEVLRTPLGLNLQRGQGRQGVHLLKPSLSLRAGKAPSEVRLCQSQVPETPSDKALQIHLRSDAGLRPSLPSDATDVSDQVLSAARSGNTQDQ